MNIPSSESLLRSAIAYLREKKADFEAELLSRCKIEIGSSGQRYTGTTKIGLNLTLRCKASDLEHFRDNDSAWDFDSD